MKKLSVVVPSIRTNNLKGFYDALSKSCKNYSWELILISPFDLPDELKSMDNIKLVKDYGHPTRCLQLGLFEIEGELMYHTTDDARFFEGAIDKCIEYYDSKCSSKDVVNMRYREGENFQGKPMPDGYWWAWFHGDLQLPGIPKNFKISLHHMLKSDYLISLGGYDCNFEHANFSLHDLMFRIQFDGGIIYDSPMEVTNCNHFPGKIVDHAPIYNSHFENDLPYFRNLYSIPDVLAGRKNLDINNWALQSSIWNRRFKNIPKSYDDVLKQNEG